MDDIDASPVRFQQGWRRDYTQYSDGEMKEVLEEDWTREFLLVDYEQAGEDGRNRDTLLHNAYYVGLVLFGLLLNAGLSLHRNQEYGLLFGASFAGAVLYFLLFVWSKSSKGARDASWNRRSEIEDMVKAVQSNVLRSNDSCFKRLVREGDGRYRLRGKGRIEGFSVGKLIVYLNAVVGVGFLFIAVWSLCRLMGMG